MTEQHQTAVDPDEKNQKSPTEELSQLILGSMRTFSGEETVAWLKNVSEDVPQGEEAASAKLNLSQTQLADNLFDHFDRYAREFNRQNVRSTNLIVKVNRPAFNATRDHFYGSLTVQEWGLVISGEGERVLGHVVRAEFVPDFHARRHEFVPFVELEGMAEPSGMFWRVEGDEIKTALLPVIAKKLFARLIRVAKGEANELEPFVLKLKDLSSQERAHAMLEHEIGQHLEAVVHLCLAFLKCIDEERDALAQLGVKSMQNRDGDNTKVLMKRSYDLKALREGSAEVMKKWQLSLEEIE